MLCSVDPLMLAAMILALEAIAICLFCLLILLRGFVRRSATIGITG